VLSFENAPPFSAPLRFFLTAPLFAVLAGLLLVIEGPVVFTSRWTPGALAATHLLTVGFMLQVMLGALIQVLPVVAGADLPRPLALARAVHVGLTGGGLLLVGGFWFGLPWALAGGALLLGLTVFLFLIVMWRALLGVPSTSPTIRGIKFALLGLAVVVGLGLLMALALAEGWPLPLPLLADLHAGWGLAGWAGVLLAAMAYVVVPMFQLTPGYPARPSWWFPLAILAALLVWSIGVVFDLPWLVRASQLAAAVAGITFAGLTLRLQGKRRRAKADATYRYWQMGMMASILALLMLGIAAVWPAASELDGWTIGFGILIVAGGFLSFIVGMLYKIVPFLAWMHLQNYGATKATAPAMPRLMPDVEVNRQMQAYGVALVLLLAAVVFPDWLGRLAGLAFALANGGLAWVLFRAVGRYRQAWLDMTLKLAIKKK